MSRCCQARLPVGPLLAHADNNYSLLARQLGVHHKQIHRWAATGGVPYYAADWAAIRIGSHPANIWGADWHRAGIEQTDLEAAHADRVADTQMRQWLGRQPRAELAARRRLVDGYHTVERARLRVVR